MYQFCVRADRRLDRLDVARIDECRFDLVTLGKQFRKKTPHGLIGHVTDDDVISGSQQREEHGVKGSDTGGEHGSILALLHGRELLLEPDLVVTGVSGVERNAGVGPVDVGRIGRQMIGVCHDDWRPDRAGGRIDFITPMHRQRFEGKSVWVLFVRSCSHFTNSKI
ncbi:hypothetical protein D3C80_888560 [compost metagenome]